MADYTPALHHVSAIAGDPQQNVDFFTEVLGMRLVKQTVNFDEKFMYHLYYGDHRGSPGSLITFFPNQRGREGRIGQPQPSATTFAVPNGAIPYWQERLDDRGVDVDEPIERFGETVLQFRDPDGQRLELVARETDRPPVTESFPRKYAIRGLCGVTLLSSSVYHTAALLEILDFSPVDQQGERVRYGTPDSSVPTMDLLDTETSYGREGSGTVHHVAFRKGTRSLEKWREYLFDAGLEPTRIKDRRYFKSLYFRGPGGILFEIATEGPGFTIDADRSELGANLQLPPRYEPDREMITRQLPELALPDEPVGPGLVQE
ncbi:VOC family protein [Haloarcula litorea]|uniref:VOC family protein n=1 Tax=Haloarcula litorea TaxID=3032579 RepID=UPI0023E75A13|nr:VOC family protein [Halomicroarcula sp. GDY20]